MTSRPIAALLTVTELGMLAYWIFALAVVSTLISVPPDLMYSDYRNPVIVSWNWSFFPIDILFSIAGLSARFGRFSEILRDKLGIFSLSLMFCAGLMAISFWMLQGWFDPFWWGTNIWLMLLASYVLLFGAGEKHE